MTTTGPRTLSEDQSRRLASVHLMAARDGGIDAPRKLIDRLAAVFEVKVALVANQAAGWTVLAEAPAGPKLECDELAAIAGLEAIATRDQVEVMPVASRSRTWTIVGLTRRAGLPAALLIDGDWSRSSSVLMQLAANLLFAERTFTLAADARVRIASHRLARRLARCRGTARIGEVVVETIARTLAVSTVSLAVPDPREDAMRIVATYGYPLELVSSARIALGEGVLGRVFQSKAPLRIADIRTTQGVRRARYGGHSVMLLPIVSSGTVLGILSVTDRQDNRQFTADDMSRLRTLAAPLALALQRESAALQAETYAHAASIDAVSGLFNRRYFGIRLEEELERARRQKSALALILLDVDDFKAVNDQFGHLTGDAVIHDIAETIRSSLRMFDVCARWGGEEFAVLMPGAATDVAVHTAERIRARIAAQQLPNLDDRQVTISVGVTSTDGRMTSRELVAAADQALYAAKRSGKNQVHSR